MPDKYEDEMWAGEYYFRRTAGDFVSIEMKNAYLDTLIENDEEARNLFYRDSLKMFVFVGMYTQTREADSVLKIIKPKLKNANIISSQIFMGCMH